MKIGKNSRNKFDKAGDSIFSLWNLSFLCFGKALLVLLSVGIISFDFMQPATSYADFSYTYLGNGAGSCSSVTKYVSLRSPSNNVRLTGFRIKKMEGADIRVAIFSGGTSQDPTGAVKLYDTGPLQYPDTSPDINEDYFPIDIPVDLPSYTQFGVAIKIEPTSPAPPTCYHYYTGGQFSGVTSYSLNESSDTAVPFNSVVSNATYEAGLAFSFRLYYILYPVIDSLAPSGFFSDNQSDLILEGSGFYKYTSGAIWLTENNDWSAPGIKVQQVDTSWSDSSITFNTSFGALTPGTTAYLWVENYFDATNTEGFPVTLDASCGGSPPLEVPDSNTITPDSGTHVPGTYSISTEYTSVDNPVLLCMYTIDDGGVWTPGVVSGSGPSYTCTVNGLTAVEGTSLAVRTRATSCSGTTVSSLLSRVVDTTGPVLLFSQTPGDTQCLLEWSATDSGSGMHSTEPYEVRWSPDTYPNSQSDGSLLYIGMDTSFNHTGLTNGDRYFYRVFSKDELNNAGSSRAGDCILNATPWGLLNDGISPVDKFVGQSFSNIGVSTFTLEITNGSGTDTDIVTDLIVTGTNTSNINAVKLYRDDGTTVNEYDDGEDLFITSTGFTGNEAIFNELTIQVTETPERYLITYDTGPGVLNGETFTGYVSSATAQIYSVTNNDDVDATITVELTPPFTTDDTPSNWARDTVTVTLTPDDGAGSGVDQASGIFGCFDAGCMPVLLGSNSMTTSCAAGNVCTQEVRYYSVDRIGNVEPVKAASNLARMDMIPPALGGTINVMEPSNPIHIYWQGFFDADSGLHTTTPYKILRENGSQPPVDCDTGTVRYQGASSFFDDYSVNEGQLYTYRLCVYDAAGNVQQQDNIISAVGAQAPQPCPTFFDCENCHGFPPGMNPPSEPMYSMAGAHMIHWQQMVGCWFCHEDSGGGGGLPGHVNGKIDLQSLQIGLVSPIPDWPSGPGMTTCGGPGSPVGGDSNGGPDSCHMGTTSYPNLTPDDECFWEPAECNMTIDYNDCNTCHGIPPGTGMDAQNFVPGAHAAHLVEGCGACHFEFGPDPNHLNDTITIAPETGWNGSPNPPWPNVPMASCGGQAIPVGGPGNPMGCHSVGTPNFPALTPDWECTWEEPGMCNPPPQP